MASTLKAVALSLFFPLIANAQTPLPPTYEALTNAAATGGDFRFSGAGTIIIPTPVSFASATTLDADGHAVILSGGGKSSILQLETNVTLTLRGVELIDGLARGLEEAGALKAGQGGAIVNLGGNLTLKNCILSNNIASGATNKIGLVAGPFGDLVMGPLPVARPAGDAAGGAIWQIGGRLVIEDCAFSMNRVSSSFLSGGPGEGGAIYIRNAEGLDILRTRFLSNSVVSGGTSFYYPELSSPAKGGAIYVEATPARIDGGEISGNGSAGGSGISLGGAIYQGGSSLTVSNAFVGQNGSFGGFNPGRLMQRGFDAAGGAIYSDGELMVDSSAFLSNICAGGQAANGAGRTFAYGGAISSDGSIAIVNSTMVGNQSYSSSQTNVTEGGAVYCGGRAGITNSTIVGHLQSLSPLGAGSTNTITVKNTLFAGNRYEPQRNPVVDAGHNLSSDAGPPFTESTSANGVNPKLGPLRLYGGSTPIYSLAAGSPAIDTADDSAAPAKDQRGRTRPFGAHADIGAFESSPPFFVWGKIRGYVDPATAITIGTTTNLIDSDGSFFIGPLESGVHMATLSAPTAALRPNPWLIASDADRELSEVKSYKLHAITFEHELDDPAFVLAGDAGEVWEVELSPDFSSWTEYGPFTIPNTGLTNVPAPANAPFMFMRGSYAAPAP